MYKNGTYKANFIMTLTQKGKFYKALFSKILNDKIRCYIYKLIKQ